MLIGPMTRYTLEKEELVVDWGSWLYICFRVEEVKKDPIGSCRCVTLNIFGKKAEENWMCWISFLFFPYLQLLQWSLTLQT